MVMIAGETNGEMIKQKCCRSYVLMRPGRTTTTTIIDGDVVVLIVERRGGYE
jgi:hypothetical protein